MHPDIERIAYGGTKTILDLDLLLWAPGFLFGEIAPYSHQTFQGLASLGEDHSHDLDRAIQRRRSEMQEFLAMGRTMILFVPAPREIYRTTGHSFEGSGRNSRRTNHVARFSLLSVLPFDLKTVAAATTSFELIAGPPFAKFWKAHANQFAAAAYVDKGWGSPLVQIGKTDKVVAALRRDRQSIVLALPELREADLDEGAIESDDDQVGEDESKDPGEAQAQRDNPFFVDLFDLIESLRGEAGSELPPWTEKYQLPGEGSRLDRVLTAKRELAEVAGRVAIDEQALAVLRNRKALFVGYGMALERLVDDAFQALGAEVRSGPEGRTDRIARFKERTAVVEIKGKSKSAAEADSAQLEKWVSDYVIAHGLHPKPILVVNAWRETPLNTRSAEAFPSQMLNYATARGHCLITGLQLLGAWMDCEEHPDKADQIADSIFSCMGRYSNYADWRLFIAPELQTAQEITP